jgi:RimJ/RimL family protein N-acetyltransferase
MTFYEESVFARMKGIRTERLYIRRLTMRDAAVMFEYCRDPQWRGTFCGMPTAPSNESRAYIRYMLRRYRVGDAVSCGQSSTRRAAG